MSMQTGSAFGDPLRAALGKPLARLKLTSAQQMMQEGFAQQEAATNLLLKAMRALADGDLGRARTFVCRAERLPYEEGGDARPVAVAARMMLFNLVTDLVESAEPHEDQWLQAALEVLPDLDPAGRQELCHVLREVDGDYRLERAESKALRAAVAGMPDRGERGTLDDVRLAGEPLCDRVMAVLRVIGGYERALDGLFS